MIRKTVFLIFFILMIALPLAAKTNALRLGYAELWPVHAFLMSASFMLMLTGMLVSRYYKKKRGWLKTHRLLEWFGAASGILGFAIAIYMVSVSTGVHFRVVHSIVGLITIISMTLNPILGYNILRKKRDHKPGYRILHRWIGRTMLIGMLVTILLGLFLAGIL